MDAAERTDVRSRGVLLTGSGLDKLRRCASLRSTTFEYVAEQVSLSAQTVARVWHAEEGVDRRTIERIFTALGLDLTRADFVTARARSTPRTPAPLARPPSFNGAPATRQTDQELIGRQADLDAVERQFKITRLVTITGPAGVGKTRLALAAAERLFAGIPRLFVDVTRCASGDGVERAIRTALQPYGRPGGQSCLRGAETILIVDGCEVSLDACANVVLDLLTSDDSLRIIATSREPLDVQGESECRLRGLGVPSIYNEGDHRVRDAAAVRLFVARAKMTREGGGPDTELLATISSIVRCVDGNPLAIERAAARLKMLSCTDLAARLSISLSLLNDDVRAVPARSPSLRERFERSYMRLSPVEQDLLRRMSVFVGGWTADAASGVCGDLEPQVFETLSRLVKKSCVLVEDDVAGRRYRLPSIWQQHALEALTHCGDDARASVAAMGYFLELAHSAKRAFTHGQAYAWFARMRAEHDNFEYVFRWAFKGLREPELGAELAVALTPYWVACGRFDDGIRWLKFALSTFEDKPSRTDLQLRLAISLARVLRYSGLPNQADAVGRDAVRACGPHQGETLSAEARFSAAATASPSIDLQSRRQDLVAYATHCRAVGSDALQEALLTLAEFELDCAQDFEAATALARESWELARRAQHPFSEARALSACARIADARGDYEQAVAGGDHARVLFMALGNVPLGTVEIARTAVYRVRFGRTAEAFQELARARRFMRPAGIEAVAIGYSLAECLTTVSRPDDAVFVLGAVEAARRAAGMSLTPRDAAYQTALIARLSSMSGLRFPGRWLAGVRASIVDAIDAMLVVDSAGPLASHRKIAN